MNKTVNYAVNPVKTAYDSKAAEEASMTANIAYALYAEKGTTRLFQTAVNLDGIETAWDEMKEAKECWGKTDGIQGFHVVQSFAPGEATPELAHKIGVEFVEHCFPDFQAVIGTHLDKHHIHNHIVLNSVSYVDGHKYHSSQKSYYNELRKVSDKIASPDDQRSMFMKWCAVINSLDVGASIKLTLFNRRVNKNDYEESIMMPLQGNEHDQYRKEWNRFVEEQAISASNNITQDKLLTVSVPERLFRKLPV